MLSEIPIHHHCEILSLSFHSVSPNSEVSVQVWRPTRDPDSFILAQDIQIFTENLGIQEVELVNDTEGFSLLPGDTIGIQFRQKNPITFDYSSVCDHAGILLYSKSSFVAIGEKVRFLKKMEANKICRYFSLSLKVRKVGRFVELLKIFTVSLHFGQLQKSNYKF